jgi:hypothetical protein
MGKQGKGRTIIKKSIVVILTVAILNMLGCASAQTFTASEYKQLHLKEDKPNEIYIFTKDDQEFHFNEPILIFQSDTLHVKGILTGSSEQQVNKNIALADIESIRFYTEIVSGTSFLIILGIGGLIYRDRRITACRKTGCRLARCPGKVIFIMGNKLAFLTLFFQEFS